MRTVLASLAFAAASQAMAHEGHGESGMHWHGGDLLTLIGTAAVVCVWLWRRGRS